MKSPRSPATKHQQNVRLDRHSGTGLRGLPKKNGAGGKTVWGNALDQAPVACLDKKDPNYDSDSDMMVPPDFELTPPTTADSAKKAQQASESLSRSASAVDKTNNSSSSA